MDKTAIEQIYEKEKARFFQEWATLLKIPSISADPAHSEDCTLCAQWLLAHLHAMGLKTELLETVGKPVAYAEFNGPAGSPTVVYYGHYDVQPVDPINLWESPPFEPTIRNGRLYARGAQDNKGQTFYFLKALETLLRQDALKCSLKIFLEGEEETQSIGLTKALPYWKERVKGDVLMVCDTGCVGSDYPTITMGLRGIVHLTIKITGPAYDLHSGAFGGAVKNPALELARLLATFHDSEGKITVDGFYEGVDQSTDEDRALANRSPLDVQALTAQLETPLVGGEKGWTTQERIGFRPTIEINGIHSGYGGPGSKTIIPSVAIAKITSRLTGKQDPQKTLERIISHVRKHAPEGVRTEIEESGIGGPAVMLSASSPWIQKAHAILAQISPNSPVYSWEGGSIPVVAHLAEISGAAPVLVGFGLEEDRIHAPNESFSLEQFKKGFLYASLFLANIA